MEHTQGHPESSLPEGHEPVQLADVCDALDARAAGAPDRPSRRAVRWPFRDRRVALATRIAAGAQRSLQCACRNLSYSGVGLLTREPLPMGRLVQVSLPHPQLGSIPISGSVTRCRRVDEAVFEVGVRFDQPVDVREYLAIDPFSNEFLPERTEPARITGHVVMLGGSEFERAMFQRTLRRTSAFSLTTSHLHDAIRVAPSMSALVCSCDDDDPPVPTLLTPLVEHGFRGKLLLMVSDQGPRTRERVLALPYHAIVLRPLGEDLLLRALTEVLVLRRRGESSAAA